MATQSGQDKVFQIFTDQIMDMLEEGTVPWRQPWKGGKIPMSFQTKRPYRGMNVWFLNSVAIHRGYTSNWWVSLKSVKKAKGWIKDDEFKKSVTVIFCRPKRYEVETDEVDEQGQPVKEERMSFIYFYHTVWNMDQVEGMTAPDADQDAEERTPNQILEEAQAIIDGYQNGPEISHGGTRAFYRPSDDSVTVPEMELFQDSENYYHVMYHELAHSTGHGSRLGRKGVMDLTMFGSHDYSKEELVAEMGAGFLGALVGLTPRTIDNTAAYIQSWLKALNDDKRLLVYAASKGQAAAEHILGVTWEG